MHTHLRWRKKIGGLELLHFIIISGFIYEASSREPFYFSHPPARGKLISQWNNSDGRNSVNLSYVLLDNIY